MYTKLTYYVMILIPIWCLMSLRWNSTGSYCPWMTLGYNPILWNSLRGKRTFLGFFIMPRLNFFLQSNSIENNRRTKFTTSGEMQWKEYVTLNTETPALGFFTGWCKVHGPNCRSCFSNRFIFVTQYGFNLHPRNFFRKSQFSVFKIQVFLHVLIISFLI